MKKYFIYVTILFMMLFIPNITVNAKEITTNDEPVVIDDGNQIIIDGYAIPYMPGAPTDVYISIAKHKKEYDETHFNIDNYTYTVNDYHLTSFTGTCEGPSGHETYYNLDMSGCIDIMRSMGYDEDAYPYWIREDGCKMFGPYIMVAAELGSRPKGTILQCSLGEAIVVDTGEFASSNPTQLDIAVTW